MKRSELIRDIIAFALMFLLGGALIALLEGTARPAEPADVQRLYDHTYNTQQKPNYFIHPTGVRIWTKQVDKRIKLAPPHDDYDWIWEIHIAYIWFWKDETGTDKPILLGLSIKHYECNVAGPFKDVTIQRFYDYKVDGILDGYDPDFLLESDDESLWWPNYPDGFVNPKWFSPPEEEKQAMYDKEIQFWLNQMQTAGEKDAKP